MSNSTLAELPAGWRKAIVLMVMAWLILHVVETQQANINWDEFALLERADNTARSGKLDGGGRGGLATMALTTITPHFDNEVEAVNAARLLWLLPTLAILLFVYLITRRLFGPDTALLTLLLLIAMPSFSRWSLQVRTDQFAAAFGLAACFLALPWRSGRALAMFLAGLCLGYGWLSTQKLIYILGFMGLAILFSGIRDRTHSVRTTLVNPLFIVAGFFAAIISFNTLLMVLQLEPAATSSLARGSKVFSWYQEVFGWSYYRELIPTHFAHILLLVMALLLSLHGLIRDKDRLQSFFALVCLFYASLVLYVHKAAFPYFFIILGILFCLAAGPPMLKFSMEKKHGRFIVASLVLSAVFLSLPGHRQLLQDTQQVQREVARIANAATDLGMVGFQCENALFYGDGDFPTYFTQSIRLTLLPGSEAEQDFLSSFKAKEVRYVVLSYRLASFPAAIKEFFRDNYHLVHSRILVLGARISRFGGIAQEFSVAATGQYRLYIEKPGSYGIEVDGQKLVPGQTIFLVAGKHQFLAAEMPEVAVIGWDLPALDLAKPQWDDSFYSKDQLAAFGGEGYARQKLAVEKSFY